jgi:hypothetical protein
MSSYMALNEHHYTWVMDSEPGVCMDTYDCDPMMWHSHAADAPGGVDERHGETAAGHRHPNGQRPHVHSIFGHSPVYVDDLSSAAKDWTGD